MAAPDRAYAFAKARILDGRFPGGTLITEGNVAAATGLSRTPVREAFARLASEGLLKVYPMLVERFAIEKVIEFETDLGSAPEAAIAKQEQFAANNNLRAFIKADHEFHRVFVAAAANTILLQLHDSMRDRQNRMGLVALLRDDSRTLEALEEHRMLVRAVAARDGDAAREVVQTHLGATLALLRGRPSLVE
jgi:DNA-binding GntR family transcriptional regulator